MAEAIFKVAIASAGFPALSRSRAGIVVTKEHGYEGPLTGEQLEAIKADPQLQVEEPAVEKKSEKKSK